MRDYDFAAEQSAYEIRIISKSELAKMLGVDVRTIHRMVQYKQVKPPLRTPKGYIRGWCLQDLPTILRM